MHPEPNTLPETRTLQESAEYPQSTSQHGLHDHRPVVPQSSARDVGAGTTAASSAEHIALDAALAASLRETSATQSRADRGLKSRHTPSPPAGNRIDEYEKASTPPVGKRRDPTFEVIKTQRKPGDKRSPIQDLPNGKTPFARYDRGIRLTVSRNFDALSGALGTDRFGLCLARLEAIPRFGHWPTCLANSLCPLLYWTRLYQCSFTR